MRYEMFKEKGGYWCWRLVDGKKLIAEGVDYESKADCRRSIELVKSSKQVRVWNLTPDEERED